MEHMKIYSQGVRRVLSKYMWERYKRNPTANLLVENSINRSLDATIEKQFKGEKPFRL